MGPTLAIGTQKEKWEDGLPCTLILITLVSRPDSFFAASRGQSAFHQRNADRAQVGYPTSMTWTPTRRGPLPRHRKPTLLSSPFSTGMTAFTRQLLHGRKRCCRCSVKRSSLAVATESMASASFPFRLIIPWRPQYDNGATVRVFLCVDVTSRRFSRSHTSRNIVISL